MFLLPTIAVDVMGADGGPNCVIKGCAMAVQGGVANVTLVGVRQVIEPALRSLGLEDVQFNIQEASQVISNHEKPALAVRRKGSASINVACRLLMSGEADALVTAGNSGAALVSATLGLGCLSGIERPALMVSLPSRAGKDVVLLDVGATVATTPQQLFQFAHLGTVFVSATSGRQNPSVALMSNGVERGKGTLGVRDAAHLLEGSGLNYIGLREGQDIFSGEVDVLVCDGFVGNVLLKAVEGVVEYSINLIESHANNGDIDGRSGHAVSSLMHEQLHFSRRGGALLGGVNGLVVVAHGRSDAAALFNSIRLAAGWARAKVLDQLRAGLASVLG